MTQHVATPYMGLLAWLVYNLGQTLIASFTLWFTGLPGTGKTTMHSW